MSAMFYLKAASGAHRGGESRSGAASRIPRASRREVQDEVHLDFNQDTKLLMTDILKNVSRKEGVTKGRRLAYLNGLVKLLQYVQSRSSANVVKSYGYSVEEICMCLRTCLINEATVVRMAALRALRYLIQDESDIIAMNLAGIPYLVVRSLDVVLNNSGERLQAARFCQRLLAVPNGAENFPSPITRALVAIGFDGLMEPDKLHRGSLSLLCQLAILNPQHFIENGGVRVLLHNVLGCTTPMVLEAILGSLLHLLNVPETRNGACLNLHALVAPLTDPHFKLGIRDQPDKDMEEQETGHRCAKVAIGTVLRSWSGIAHFCQSENSGLQALIDALYIEQLQIRRTILNLICEIIGLKFPTWTDEVSVALSAVDAYYPQDSWKLQHEFLVQEAMVVLPHLSATTPNITANHKALLVYCFAKRGLLDALVEVIVTSDTFISVRASVLLGELLNLVDRYLPVECFDPSQCIPSLIRHAMTDRNSSNTVSNSSTFSSSATLQLKQHRALEAISILKAIHRIKSRPAVPCSIFLMSQLKFAGYTAKHPDKFVDRLGQVQLTRLLKKDMDTNPNKLLKECGIVTSKDPMSWQWELISTLIRWAPDTLKKVEDSSWKTFLRRLLDFFKPSNNVFARMELIKDQTKLFARVGCSLVQFLCDDSESFIGATMLEELLSDISSSLDELLRNPQNPYGCFLSPNKLETSASQYYFLFIGQLTQHNKGIRVLERQEILKKFLALVKEMQHESYVKLIVSSLDYADDFCRHILNAALLSNIEGSRLYATQFLRVLVRAKLPGFSKWGMELLVNQLNDKHRTVALAALDILEEAIHDKMYLESLIALRPSLTHLGDRGLLILICFVSLPSGYKFLLEANFLKIEIEKWKNIFNKRYVELVEVLVRDTVSTLRRGEDGKYPKRPSGNQEQSKFVDIYVPPHLYGQLAQHKLGLELLLELGNIYDLIDLVNKRKCDTPEDTRDLKAGLWALGHVATSIEALPIVEEGLVLETMVHLAAWCPVLSVRHTAFHCLCLISSTQPGAELVRKFEWHAMPRNHHELAPVWGGAMILAEKCFKSKPLNQDLDLESEIDLLDNASLNSRSDSNNLIEEDGESGYFMEDGEDLLDDASFRDQRSGDNSIAVSHIRSHSESQATQGSRNRNGSFSTSKSGSSFGNSSSFRPVDSSTLKWFFSSGRGGSLKERPNNGDKSNGGSSAANVSTKNFATISGVSRRTWAISLSENFSTQSTSPEHKIQNFSAESGQHLSPIPSSPSLTATILSNPVSASNLSPPSRDNSRAFTDPGTRLGSPNYIYRSMIRKPIIQVPLSSESDIFPPSVHQRIGSVRTMKATSLDRRFMRSPKDLFLESKLMRVNSSMTSLSTPSFRAIPENESKGPCFMGLCLPKRFTMIFLAGDAAKRFPSSTPSSPDFDEVDLDSNLNLRAPSEDVFEFHSHRICMACLKVVDSKVVPAVKVDGVKQSFDCLLGVENIEGNRNSMLSIGSFLSSSSVEDGDTRKIIPNSIQGKNLLRKEIIRLVTSMISCVGAKSNEQGLLRLKQKFPKAFHDLCLYSELCAILSSHNVRLALRRFIQELFLDLPYEEFYQVASNILQPETECVTSATTTDTSECSTVIEVRIPVSVIDTDQSIAEIDTDDPTPCPSPSDELDSDYVDLK